MSRICSPPHLPCTVTRATQSAGAGLTTGSLGGLAAPGGRAAGGDGQGPQASTWAHRVVPRTMPWCATDVTSSEEAPLAETREGPDPVTAVKVTPQCTLCCSHGEDGWGMVTRLQPAPVQGRGSYAAPGTARFQAAPASWLHRGPASRCEAWVGEVGRSGRPDSPPGSARAAPAPRWAPGEPPRRNARLPVTMEAVTGNRPDHASGEPSLNGAGISHAWNHGAVHSQVRMGTGLHRQH